MSSQLRSMLAVGRVMKHPDELVRVESVIQLWLAQQSGRLEQCRDPVALIRWNSEFRGGIDSGPSTVDKDDKVWSGRGGRKACWRKVTLIPLLKITKPRI